MFCQALDSGKEVRFVFCEINKAFDRVLHAASLLNIMQLVSPETFMHGSQIISLTGNSELFSLARFLIGLKFVLEFPKD